MSRSIKKCVYKKCHLFCENRTIHKAKYAIMNDLSNKEVIKSPKINYEILKQFLAASEP
jgi:hypothetical protein